MSRATFRARPDCTPFIALSAEVHVVQAFSTSPQRACTVPRVTKRYRMSPGKRRCLALADTELELFGGTGQVARVTQCARGFVREARFGEEEYPSGLVIRVGSGG
ncbi:hypothetical protein AB0H00_04660 [Nocardia sp. NPDC023852]|uniref:hypothetical protein n=1 Tax=Nocardia sp. NPDC023852 TaxID=3154697 RepID=UPI0033FEF21B